MIFMKGAIHTWTLIMIISTAIIPIHGVTGSDSPGPRLDLDDVEWIGTDSINISTFLNRSLELRIDHDSSDGRLTRNSTIFDPYFTHNSTIRAAIDTCPQWLNDTLSWKFIDINQYNSWKYTSILLDPDLDARFIDEIAFFIGYTSPDILNSFFTVPTLIIENVEMMYRVSSDVDYAMITDTIRSDGRHSTLVYSTPSGNVTLPEDIYYRYLVMPVNEMEQPAYINLTTFQKTDDPEKGVFWRSYLYNANDTGFPVLSQLLANETTLWNGTRNQVANNGAVGAVTGWESSVMDFRYQEGMRRDHQPVSIYKQHFGLCGENAQVLVAAAKIALIPAVVTINFDMMHAWNEFYESGWHQWEGYSHRIDDPAAEGVPGAVTVMTNLDPDGSFFTNTDLYTPTTNLTVNVRDRNGFPVDGAMVKIFSQPGTNHYGLIPLLGNATDVNGNADFMVGSGFQYYVQVLSPIGGWLNSSAALPLAFPTTDPGKTQIFNITLDSSMPLKANLSGILGEMEYGFRFEVNVKDIVQRTRFHRDPWGYYETIERGYPDRTGLEVYFLDDENLSAYYEGREFYPAAALNLTKGDSESITLPYEGNWHVVIPGLSRPLTRTFISLEIRAKRSVVDPRVVIISPGEGTYLVDEIIDFSGSVEPILPGMGNIQHVWKIMGGIGYLSTESSFSTTLPYGSHVIEYLVFNETGLIGLDSVNIRIEYPNRPPESIIGGLEEGAVIEFGTRIVLTGEGSTDPDNDTLTFTWRDEDKLTVLSRSVILNTTFKSGNHNISLTAGDPDGLEDKAFLTFRVLEPNLKPVPIIMSPEPWSIFEEGEEIEISAEGSYDLDEDMLQFRWEDSIDGNISNEKEDSYRFSIGLHTLTLFVHDGRETSSDVVRFHVVEREPEPDLEPVSNIFSPANGMRFHISDDIEFSAFGSFDPEGSELSYLWEVDGMVVSRDPEFTLQLDEGVHLVNLTVFDSNHSSTMSSTIIVLDRSPILSLKVNGTEMNSSNEVILLGNVNYTFDGSQCEDPDGLPIAFTWKLGDVVISEESTFMRSFEPGIHYLTLEIDDGSKRSVSKVLLLRILDTGDGQPDEDRGNDRENDNDISFLFYLIPFIIILISLAVIIFVIIRYNSIEGEDDQGQLD
jgi:hypothetical protein